MSNKTKHTPGPWFAVGNEVHDRATRFDPNSGARTGATASRICMAEYPYGDDDGKAANANLIAAAPELLEALQAAVDCGMVPQSTAEDGAVRHSRHVQVADMIRAAITKATGGAQ